MSTSRPLSSTPPNMDVKESLQGILSESWVCAAVILEYLGPPFSQWLASLLHSVEVRRAKYSDMFSAYTVSWCPNTVSGHFSLLQKRKTPTHVAINMQQDTIGKRCSVWRFPSLQILAAKLYHLLVMLHNIPTTFHRSPRRANAAATIQLPLKPLNLFWSILVCSVS